MADHELVIIAWGNLPSAVTYWLQERQAPTVRLRCGLPDPDLIASLEIFG
jgi:hypothetical protein